MSGFLTSLGIAAGSGLMNAIGSIFSSNRQQQQSKELMDYQAGLQRKQQTFFNQQHYPQMINSMRMAGLNPNFGNGVQQGVSAGMPSASAGKVDSPTFDMVSAANTYSQLKLNEAQADLMRSEAEKNRELTEGQQIQNDTAYIRLYSDLELAAKQGRMFSSQADLSSQQIEQVKANIDSMSVQTQKVIAEIGQIMTNNKLTEKQIKWYDSNISAQIQQVLANAQFLSNSDKREWEKVTAEIYNLRTISEMNNSITAKNKIESKMSAFLLKQSERYDDAERVINLGSRVLGAVGTAVGSFAGGYIGAGAKVAGAASKGFNSTPKFDWSYPNKSGFNEFNPF